MKFLSLVSTLLLLSSICVGQILHVNDFVESPIPKLRSKELTDLYPAKIFSVQIINGGLQITKSVPHPSTLKYETTRGTFWAENKGEWGGGVYYKPNDTTIKTVYVNGKPVTIKNYTYLHDTISIAPLTFSISGLFLVNPHNTNALFNFKGALYFINNGVNNLKNKSGSINKIIQHSNVVINTLSIADFETSSDLRNSPTAMATKGNKIYVVTDKCLYIIKNHKNEMILKDMFWQNLAPSSIAVIGRKEVMLASEAGM